MNRYQENLSKFKETGVVVTIDGSILTVEGLPSCAMGELVVFENKAFGVAHELDEWGVHVLVLGGDVPALGIRAARTAESLNVAVSDSILGKIVNGLGLLRDGVKNSISGKQVIMRVDAPPLPIYRRRNVTEPLETGVAIVDILVPLGRGQRELVIGDRKTGKTEFVRQAMLAHMLSGGICVYGGIARRAQDMVSLEKYFADKGVLERIVIVSSLPSDTTGHVYYTPYTAMAIAEYFRNQGANVLAVFDDLTLHAKYCRELALLSRQSPGRDAYPGDIFYSHSRLMERAGVFDTGSITCLPIADTVLGDLSGYIQTNLMSMTDGHLFFDHDLYNQGRRPPVNVFLSVSRVGRQTQTPLLRSIGQELTRFLSQHQRLQKIQHFGGELTGEVKRVLALGKLLEAFFEQTEEMIIPTAVAAVCVASIWAGMWEGYSTVKMQARIKQLVKLYYSDQHVNLQFNQKIKSYIEFTQLIEAVKTMPDVIMGKAG